MTIDLACIIDDDPIHVFLTRKMMEIIDFCKGVLIFHNGYEALKHLQPVIEQGGQTPEIILLDLNMPVMDGWEFLDEFITIPSKKPITIFIVSSSMNPADFARAEQYKEVNNYLVKPISTSQLKGILKSYQHQ